MSMSMLPPGSEEEVFVLLLDDPGTRVMRSTFLRRVSFLRCWRRRIWSCADDAMVGVLLLVFVFVFV